MSFLKKITRPITRTIRSVGREIRRWMMPDMPGKEALKLQRKGSDHWVPVIYGQQDAHGIIVDWNTSTDKKFLYVLYVFAMGEIESFDRFEIDGYDENDERWNKKGSGKWFSYETRLGTDTQSAMNGFGKLERWTANSHYRGVACALFTFEMDNDQRVWRGEPQIKAYIKGRKVHDPRTDTIAYTENGALHALDYARNTVFGLGLTDDEIGIETFIEAANIADTENDQNTVTRQICEWVPDDDPNAPPVYECRTETETNATFKRFTNNTIIDTGRRVIDNLQELVNSFRGFFPDADGLLRVGVEKEGSPVFHFDDSNIIGDIQTSSGAIDERYNRVTVRFNNVENDFERDEVTFPETDSQLYTDWLAEDNGQILDHVLTAEHIAYKAEALQLAMLTAYVSRNAEQAKFTGDFSTVEVDIGDIVTVTNADRGWEGRQFRVAKLINREDGLTDFELVQHDNALYPWSGVDYTEVIGGTNLGDPSKPATPTNFTVERDQTKVTWGWLGWFGGTQFVREFRVNVRDSNEDLVFAATTTASRINIPVLAVGFYEAEVYTVSTTGAVSDPGTYTIGVLELNPIQPEVIAIEPGNFTIKVIPPATGDLGDTFDYDISTSSSHTPQPVHQGKTHTFEDLVPDTEYFIFVRPVNNLGAAGWTMVETKTTRSLDNYGFIREGFAEDISERLNDLNIELGGLDAILEQIAQDINNELATLDVKEEVREVRIQNVNQVIALVNEYLATLEGETLPELSARLEIVEDSVGNLTATVIPQINSRLDTAESSLQTLNGSVIPQLQSDLSAVDGRLDTLNNITLPLTNQVPQTIDDVLETISQDVAEIYQDVYAYRLAANSVTALAIKANAVVADKIAANAVSTDKLTANAVTADKIAANAVTADKVAARSIGADKIVANSLTANEIAAFTITGQQIAANSVNADRLVASSITADKVAALAISGDKIAANAISADKIVANSITGDKIAANTITAAEIAALTITGAEIAARTIAAGKIVSESITANEIAGLTITGDKIAALTISGEKIIARSIGADKLVANSITADEIEARTITALQIAADTLTANEIKAGAITAEKLSADAIYGKRQVITAGGVSVVTDPGTTELTSDLIMWVGPSSATTPATRTRNNALFFVSTDGAASSNIAGGRVAGQLTAVSSGNSATAAAVDTRTVPLRSNRGFVDVFGVTGNVSLSSGLSFSGTIGTLWMQYQIRNMSTNQVIAIKREEMSYNTSTGSAFQLSNNNPFFGEDDLASSNYGDTVNYRLEMLPVWSGAGSITGTWFTSTAAQITHPKLKVTQINMTY